MPNSAEIRDFLTSRRARLTPQEAGLPIYGGNRRVAGLRREEVALLAGISVEYYTRLERGNARGASESVLDAIARALQLNDAERGHLFDLVRAANAAGPPRRRPVQQQVRSGVRRLLDSITGAALLGNGRMDVLAANQLGEALYSQMFDDPGRAPNLARYLFLDARSPEFMADWEDAANDCVAILRAEAGRDPYDRVLSGLIGELSTRSDHFRIRWAAHNVKIHRTGTKRFRHATVGQLDLSYEVLDLSGDGQTMVVYTAEPGSPSAEALNLLASWTHAPQHIDLTLDQHAT